MSPEETITYAVYTVLSWPIAKVALTVVLVIVGLRVVGALAGSLRSLR